MENSSQDRSSAEYAFTLLTVCTGNICRSPLAESLFKERLAHLQNLSVASAGLHAVSGSPMDALAAEELVALGGDPQGLIGEQITDRHVASSDLILTMTLGQRDELVRRFPRATRRAFSIGEFCLLAGEAREASSLPELTKFASLNRAKSGVTTAHDVEDPFRQSAGVHRKVANQISDYVDFVRSKVL